MRRTAALASTAVALALILGACGGDDSGTVAGAAGADKTATTIKGDSSNTTVSGSDSTTAGGSTDTTDPKFSGKGSGDFCGFAKDIEKNQKDLFANDDPSNLEDSLNKFDDVMNKAISKAPSEIKDDFKTMKTALDSLKDFYAKFGNDPKKMAAEIAKDPEAAQKAMSALSDPKFEEASSRIDAYLTKVCGIDTGSDDSTDTTTN